MRKLKFLAPVALLAIVVAACGGTTTETTVAPETTTTAAAATTVAGSGSDVVTVTVTADEMSIESDVTTFKVGVTYEFVVTNVGAVAHEVMIVEPSTETDMEAIDAIALAMVDAEDLVAGATESFEYTFTEADLAGPLELACHVPGHYEAGMLLPITVES